MWVDSVAPMISDAHFADVKFNSSNASAGLGHVNQTDHSRGFPPNATVRPRLLQASEGLTEATTLMESNSRRGTLVLSSSGGTLFSFAIANPGQWVDQGPAFEVGMELPSWKSPLAASTAPSHGSATMVCESTLRHPSTPMYAMQAQAATILRIRKTWGINTCSWQTRAVFRAPSTPPAARSCALRIALRMWRPAGLCTTRQAAWGMTSGQYVPIGPSMLCSLTVNGTIVSPAPRAAFARAGIDFGHNRGGGPRANVPQEWTDVLAMH